MPYQKDTDGNEIYTYISNIATIEDGRYAKDKDGIEYYPIDSSKNEYVPTTLEYIIRDGEYILPVNSNGKPIYKKDPNDEVYDTKDGKTLLGKGTDNNQYYARKQNGDEYYPTDGTIAYYDDGVKRYAVTHQAQTIFPKDADNNEYYLMEVDQCDTRTVPTTYAKDKESNEFYPKKITKDGYVSECLVGDQYAKDKNGEYFYPKDAYGNEFYLPETKTIADRVQVRYAQTNDAKIILPSENNSAKVAAGMQPVIDISKDIVGRLVREGNDLSDFLTTKDGNVSLKGSTPINYKYKDTNNILKLTNFAKAINPKKSGNSTVQNVVKTTAVVVAVPFYKTWFFWIMVSVLLIIKSLAVWWFFLKNKFSFSR